MAAKQRSAGKHATSAGRELVITRTFHAPREVVWKAFCDADAARQWWGPKGFTLAELSLGTRVGDSWRAVMQAPDGTRYAQHGVYREIVPPERLSFTFIWDDAGSDVEMLCTFTFAERDGDTEMVFRKGPFTSVDQMKGEDGGWNESFDRFAGYLATGSG
jgi:uncharacterized protein YndB with AHSA1/START domain